MLEARVRVTDHALVFAFWFFFHLQLAQMLQEIVRNKRRGNCGAEAPFRIRQHRHDTDYAKEKILGSLELTVKAFKFSITVTVGFNDNFYKTMPTTKKQSTQPQGNLIPRLNAALRTSPLDPLSHRTNLSAQRGSPAS